MNKIEKSHDLLLPQWGPYTKKYIGISHITDSKRGLRFDLSVFPGFYRGKVTIPNVMWESNYHPWEASSDLNYYSYRHELEWKDRIYCDISFSELDENSRLICCECVNNTEIKQNLVIHYIAYMNFPSVKSYSDENIFPCLVEVPEDAVWVDGLDYNCLDFAVKRPTDNLVSDGFYRGEVRGNGFVNGSGLGDGFGKNKSDRVIYNFNLRYKIHNGCILFRFRMENKKNVIFKLGNIIKGCVVFTGNGDFATKHHFVGNLEPGEYTLEMISKGNNQIEIDGFVVIDYSGLMGAKFIPVKWDPYPEKHTGQIPNSIILKYKDTKNYYGLTWGFDKFGVREFLCSELERSMYCAANNHVSSVIKGSGNGHFLDVFMNPIILEPNSKKKIYGMLCTGTREEVEEKITKYTKSTDKAKDTYKLKRQKAIKFQINTEGKRYLFSQQRMATTTLTNVVYPIYIKRKYIKHNTPGRWWDCLYTWDSGFIGLGLLELDINRAIDCLNAYVTEPGDTHAAFIHHGSPVPVQIYLFLELWNRIQSKEQLEYFYPRLRQYYRFLAGKNGSSTTRRLKSNLITTWDYFYNSGGWDDYPPQVHVNKNKLGNYVAPILNTSHCIRTAKILYMAAEMLNFKEDMEEYNDDISLLSEAVQKYSWDDETGYFGYVCHNNNGEAVEILRHESGINFNMGMDGAYPLIAGICTEKQKSVLIGHLMNNKNMWTEIGISTVDMSAPYYRTDGYWNGAVWMAHQWFFWKTMLDLGRWESAYKIARTGLEVWKREVDETYNCFEHFIIQSGRGAGWHHFGGLSTPVLSWFAAYYMPGRLTCGFDIWVVSKKFNKDNTSVTATLRFYGEKNKKTSIIVTMNPKHKYITLWNGVPVKHIETITGTLQIDLLFSSKEGKINIREHVHV